jgi:hypothetical protein
METTFYSGPYEGMHTREGFIKALKNIPGIKINGKYDLPPKNGARGEKVFGLKMGEKMNAGRIVHTTSYSVRPNGFKSFFMGPNVYEEVEIKIMAKRKVVLEGIEKILEEALSSE